jgi:cytochrome P450
MFMGDQAYAEIFNPDRSHDYAGILEQIRTNDPVFYFDGESHKAWIVTRHDDVISLLRDERLIQPSLLPRISGFTDEQRKNLQPLQNFVEWNLGKTRERKAALRQATKRFFMPGSVKQLKERVLEVIDGLMERVDVNQPVDLIAALSYPMPAIVLGEILGAPRRDSQKFIDWSNALMKFFRSYTYEDMLETQEAVVEMMDYCAGLIEQRLKDGVGDLDLTDDFAKIYADEQFEMGELAASCATFLMAGHENTNYFIGNIFNMLFQHPDQFEKVKKDFSLIPGMMNEVLRYNGVVPFVTREVLEDMECSGHTFTKGQLVSISLFSANRDDEIFDNVNEFDITNDSARHHLGFGHGEEYCRGAHLALMEAQVLLEYLLEKYPDIEPVEGGLEYNCQPMLRRYISRFMVNLNP